MGFKEVVGIPTSVQVIEITGEKVNGRILPTAIYDEKQQVTAMEEQRKITIKELEI